MSLLLNDEVIARCKVISPASRPNSLQNLSVGLERLNNIGYIADYASPGSPCLRFAGTDKNRLLEIETACDNKDIEAILLSRGGYGTQRLLNGIPWGKVADSVARGVRWIGYSDFTAFHLALLKKTGASTIAGPMVEPDFGLPQGIDPFTLSQFNSIMRGVVPEVSWGDISECLLSGEVPSSLEQRMGNTQLLSIPDKQTPSWKGMLWGGNLSIIAASYGTSFFPEIEDGLMFIEDIGEAPYRIDRMLVQLEEVFRRQRVILIGSFVDCVEAPVGAAERSFDMADVWEDFSNRLPGVPIVFGLPFGHTPKKASLVVGGQYQLDRINNDWKLNFLVGNGS